MHVLDRPIWSALTTRQERLAQVNGPARRFPPEMAPFADMEDFSPAAFSALHGLIRPGETVVLFTEAPVAPPPQFRCLLAAFGEQMIGTPAEVRSSPPLLALTEGDAPAMRELAEIANPGPFGPRTHELGSFLGIKVGGRLAAMAGERMTPGRYTEMTAVCVYPDFRGRGYAQALLSAIARGILSRGEIPFLHVFSDNAAAIALYKRQGMTVRRRLHVTVLGRAGDSIKRPIPH